MSIENINNNQINISGLNPLESKRSGASELFENVEDIFFDREKGRWRNCLRNGKIEPGAIRSADQLLGVFTEMNIHSFKGKKGYLVLEQGSRLCDKETGQWDIELGDDARKSYDQLLAILIVERIDHDKAFNKYQELKSSKFYNQTHDFWNIGTHKEENGQWVVTSGEPDLSTELMGILVEGIFDRDEARRKYRDLEKKYYDNEKGLWISRFKNKPSPVADTQNQLLGLMVKIMFREADAGTQYMLLQGPLRDSGSGRWRHSIKIAEPAGSTDISTFYLQDQLLGVLVEKELGNSFFQEKAEPLPEVRNF